MKIGNHFDPLPDMGRKTYSERFGEAVVLWHNLPAKVFDFAFKGFGNNPEKPRVRNRLARFPINKGLGGDPDAVRSYLKRKIEMSQASVFSPVF